MRSYLLASSVLAVLGGSFASAATTTTSSPVLSPTHAPGICAIRGNCGSESFFGPQLPCLDNTPAAAPESDEVREKLISICGSGWEDVDKVCCVEQQLDDLAKNLGRADSMIAGCPACRANFVELFCNFACSPDQSMFVNVTKTSPAKSFPSKYLVNELSHLVEDDFGTGFYDSCKEVKFGGSNGKAMDLIGGGAKNFTQFLKFLGDKKFLGSPFQMNFPRPNASEGETWPEGMEPMNKPTRPCNDSDPAYKCACVDCPGSCSELPAVAGESQCFVGVLPCLSFAVILIYSVGLALVVAVITGRIAWQKRKAMKHERLRLLQDASPSDEDEEEDHETDDDGQGGLYLLRGANGVASRPPRHYALNTLCDKAFGKLGKACAEFPGLTITICLVIVGLMSIGWVRFSVERDPVRLWVSPTSDAAMEKEFFDQNFGPFFRAEQAFLVNDTAVAQGENGTVLSYDTLSWWFDVEARINRLKSPSGISLSDVCFKPIGNACVVQSISGYFQGDIRNLPKSRWAEELQDCATTPVNCLPEFQQPLNPKMVLGEYDGKVLDSKAIITTWVVNNYAEGTKELEKAMDFENVLKSTLLDAQLEAKARGLRLSFSTEVSLEQELNKSTNTDAKIVVISYIVMFLYASMALGSTSLGLRSIMNDPASALVQSKFMLGISGIVIVLMSVSASVGIFSAFGVKVTLIIAEVIPFLVLAVGVDNIFLIVHEFERVNLNYPEGSISARMSKALGRMGPSILLSATTETVAFALGAAVGMPAVRNFATYAAGAVFINAILQVTMFVSVLALNQRRVEDGRADCVPCVRVVSRNANPSHGLVYGLGMEDESTLQRFIRKSYAPTILSKRAKVVIVTFFLGLFTAGLALVPKMQLGLDQRIALPSDSYLIQYFDDLDAHFGIGPPVYFVTRELNITAQEHQRQLCARFGACDEFSLATVLELERQRPNVSYIADATASWIDDYFSWLNPLLSDCCVDPKTQLPCFETRNPAWNPALKGMPEGEEFVEYVKKWLTATTSAECPLAGQAAYGNAVVVDDARYTINASHFRTSHTPLRSQEQFISAYKAARRIAREISEKNGNIEVFPYSKFYIFFDQYVSIVSLSTALLLSGLAAVLLLSTILLGSIRTALVVTVTVAQTLVCILGSMVVAGVSLNAVSLVNLVISLGIALEFCAHVARAFTFPSGNIVERAPRSIIAPHSHSVLQNGHNRQQSGSSFNYGRNTSGASGSSTMHHNYLGTRGRSRDVRAWAALVNVGASVFSGITITKILGVAVLAFTRSKIFEVYYFRVWCALVVMGASHALVWLPVALSLFGGRGKFFSDN
jgi:Niemann-Pick C1 protein